MRTKEFHMKSESQYGQRVADLELEKKRVADAIVQRILWRQGQHPHNPLYVSDGSSASFVFCKYLQRWIKEGDETLRVWTNNLDVPMQVLCEEGAPEKVSIHSAPGEFSYKYCGNFGRETEAWIEQHCGRSTCILAVTALDADLGPCGRGEDAKAIKAAVMKAANVLIVVADHTKLRCPRDPGAAAAPDEWRRWRDERSADGRLFVVTTRSLNVPVTFGRFPLKGAVDARTPDQIESENFARLSTQLGQQLITV
ncbi:MAG TPA: hypothetical protein VGI03_04790 [Verrucomicrobiae bacterium]|jgi:hypothetical protein